MVLSQPEEQVASHPEMIRDGDRVDRADLEFPEDPADEETEAVSDEAAVEENETEAETESEEEDAE